MKRRDSAISGAQSEESTAAAPIAVKDFGDVNGANAGKSASTRAAFVGVREGNVTISAPPQGGHMSYWRRVKDKAFGKAHVRCGRT